MLPRAKSAESLRLIRPLPRCIGDCIQLELSAFEKLYDQHVRLVYSIANRIVRNAATADEIVQEVFVQFWLNWSKYDPSIGPVVSWLATIARNKSLDYMRTTAERQHRTEDTCGDSMEFFRCPNPEGQYGDEWQIERITTALSTLRGDERAAIELAYFEGLTHSEVAEKMDAPVGTVKSWIRIGLLRLRAILLRAEGRKARRCRRKSLQGFR